MNTLQPKLHPYWVSWWTPASAGLFTLHTPWWSTCNGLDGSRCICAAVMARNGKEARRLIRSVYDRVQRGEGRGVRLNWRFCSRQQPGWSPFCDRFPRESWMHWAEDR
jgi:hypothetical protein